MLIASTPFGVSAGRATPFRVVSLSEIQALNGVFTASNGDWAQTNDVYHDEVDVRSTWTISTVCSDAVTCAGQVSSDLGWTAEINSGFGEYVVKRELPDWEPCADGTRAPGFRSTGSTRSKATDSLARISA